MKKYVDMIDTLTDNLIEIQSKVADLMTGKYCS